jgi:multisubunit Na+/H+ antiporter MnhB subunit
MNKLFGWRMLVVCGAILLAFGSALLLLVLTNGERFARATVSDYKLEGAVAIAVGLYFLNKGLAYKRKKSG